MWGSSSAARRPLLKFLVAAALGLASVHAIALTPRVEPPKGDFPLPAAEKLDRIVIKFREGSGVRWRNQALQLQFNLFNTKLGDFSKLSGDLGNLNLLLQGQGLVSRPLFKLAEDTLTRLKQQGEARTGRQLADLNLYFELPLPYGFDRGAARLLIGQLNASPLVEVAYAAPTPEPAALPAALSTPTEAAATTTPDLRDRQAYLTNAPWGIDANFAATVPGGRGANVKIVDVEGGWLADHEDMPAFFYAGGTQIDDLGWRNHGTAVLGVIAGAGNSHGVTGIADQARIGYESIGSQSTASAITNAANAVGPGGIVLIELHAMGADTGVACSCNTGQCQYVAMEYWQDNFDAIQTATANGVIVVEAAGNGSTNLDHAAFNGAFDRAQRDSGAIMVAASESDGRRPTCWTNYGSRIDAHGWGYNVATLGSGDLFNGGSEQRWYTHSFSGTSSASPIVVGAVASIQGAALQKNGQPMTPAAIRSLIASTGTPQSADQARRIGPLPDLRAALTQITGGQQATCREHTATNPDHVTAGRAYGKTSWFYTTYYATGSNESLGTSKTTQVTLKEDPAGYFAKGSCPVSGGGEGYAPWIERADLASVSGATANIEGRATDRDGDLQRVEIEFDLSGNWITATGTTSFTLSQPLSSGTHTFRARAVDAGGHYSPSTKSVGFSTSAPVQACVTDRNLTHISAGRAYKCGSAWLPQACAQGSGQNLGSASTWNNPLTSVREQTPGYWVKVLSCN